ncbi:MAG: RagB/SusD family nutrient uptake outer membrane protein [Odoribacteraceae bacterium]|jgi:hypothetical protein|nr:RagB/SusD family nutrient uptake outer membrane protein [Odoribacteraceae bacterium]
MIKARILNASLLGKALVAFITLGATLGISSCNFLNVDDSFNMTMQYDSVFSNKYNIERYVWATAASFPNESSIFGGNYTPGPFATDEGFFRSWGTSEYHGMAYVLGYVSPTNLYDMNTWNSMYIIIRKANTIFARMHEATDMTTLERLQLSGYVRFMRAYAYYHMAVKYGPVVLIGEEPLENNEAPAYYNRARSTFDETCDYICAELEAAARDLPMPEQIAVTNFGRPHKAAALGLVARLRLIQASPLYNPSPGNPAAAIYFGTWKRSADGENYISQTYNEQKWADAALAAKKVMEMGIFSLYTSKRVSDTPPLPATVSAADFPDGAGNIDPFRSYSDMFTGEAVAARNPEYVWGRNSTVVQDYTRHSFPGAAYGGYNGLGVTQKVVDAYRMVDGRDIHDSSPEYPYQTTGTIGSNTTFSGYQLRSNVHNMYVNREMRFYASIGYSGRLWTCNSTSDNGAKNVIVTYDISGNAGKNIAMTSTTSNYPITGYVLTKYIHPDDAWGGAAAQRLQKNFPIIRYAEILLSYAEALNNLTRDYTYDDPLTGNTYNITRDKNEIARAFNQVRYRAGLPGLTAAELDDPRQVQALIERERLVEFLFEDRRYYDVRRWGKYEETENQLIMGMNTDASGDAYYTIVPVNDAYARNRVVDRKLVLLPLELNEVRKAPSLDQNPGWQD